MAMATIVLLIESSSVASLLSKFAPEIKFRARDFDFGRKFRARDFFLVPLEMCGNPVDKALLGSLCHQGQKKVDPYK